MSLQSLIREGNYATAQEAFDAITTPIESRNAKAWTVADLAPLFPSNINTILGTLKSVPVFESAFIALSITGLELASDARQAFIDQVATVGQWSNDLKTQVKRLGRPLLAPWQSAGLDEPTIEQVEIAFQSYQLEIAARERLRIIQEIRQKWDQISQQVRSQIETGTITADQVTTAVQQLWS